MGRHVATSSVQFLHRLQIIAKLNCVRILSCLQMDERLQFLGGERRVTGPLDLHQFVLAAGLAQRSDLAAQHLGELGVAVFVSEAHGHHPPAI